MQYQLQKKQENGVSERRAMAMITEGGELRQNDEAGGATVNATSQRCRSRLGHLNRLQQPHFAWTSCSGLWDEVLGSIAKSRKEYMVRLPGCPRQIKFVIHSVFSVGITMPTIHLPVRPV